LQAVLWSLQNHYTKNTDKNASSKLGNDKVYLLYLEL